MLIINYKDQNYAFPVGELSTNKTKQGRYEENLKIFGPKCLDDLWRHLPGICGHKAGTESLMFVLPHVAKYYCIDRNLLLQEWSNQLGVYYALDILPNPHDEVAIK